MFEVRLRSRRVRKDLDALRGTDYTRVIAGIRGLAQNPRPRGCEKLHDDIYRTRIGDIRVIYLIDESGKRIEIGGIRRRSEKTYHNINDLFR